MNSDFIQTLVTTGKLAFCTTLILFVIGLPVAYFLAYSRFKLKAVIEALISMPMVLPPTVLGFYILVAYSPQNWFGKMLEQWFDIRLAFSFNGVLIASIICSMPFMIQPLQNGLASLPVSLKEASYTLGKSSLVTFFRVLLPNIRGSVIIAIAMTFAHCVGEFGIVLMVGGNMPGATRVASIALYDEVQALNYKAANQYALILFLASFVVLTIIYSINKK
ncbi:molybdate ABC transporter permease subunit [uncultured Bacteroides sp.]|uniref:molybdate ABC transporter permease subunit n=1 Tax=uncultured Bacteroides sp. TaxID=162156 RepID=UPI002AA6DE41|nr:molybdate ABC transporter permease subunit [uncultured Bacteroides sp.]